MNKQAHDGGVPSRPSSRGSGIESVSQSQTGERTRRSSYSNFDADAVVGDYDMKRSPSTAAFVHEMIEDRYLSGARQRLGPRLARLKKETRISGALLGSASEAVLEGISAIEEDDFWKCFEKTKVQPWNWNAFLFCMWVIGIIVRYFILFPLRLLIIVIAWITFGIGMTTVQLLPCLGKGRKSAAERWWISFMSSCFVLSWGGVIRYHGHIPTLRNKTTNFVFVANHSSLIDVIVLQQVKCFSLVGQKHKGIVKFLQEVVLGCLQCIWFDRGEMRDRAVVSKKLSEHARDSTRNPLLVFPEGTCVNNEHVIQFKKGVFELGVPIAPIAIKYNKMFVDPFWSSRDQSFLGHLLELMTSWCLICDVWFLEPTVRRDGEAAEEFALRVRNSIGAKAGLKPVDWDGYLKHFQPNERLLNQRKKVYADELKKLLEDAKEAKLKQFVLEEYQYEDDFYIGAPSPTISVGSEPSDQLPSGYKIKTGFAGHHITAPHNFPPKLGPAALTQRGPRKGSIDHPYI